MEDLSLFSRRDFLKEVGVLSAASLALWAGGCESCVQQIQNRPTRKNIQNLWAANPSDPIITTYKNAVTAMKALPSSDPRSWEGQAQIHFNSVSIATGFGCPGIACTCFTSSVSAAS